MDSDFNGGRKMSIENSAEGIRDSAINGSLLPHFNLLRSLNHAITGSVIASKSRPEARIKENKVKMPKSRMCGINTGIPVLSGGR